MSSPNTASGHWSRIARLWRHVGPPLRPCAQELAFFTEAVAGWRGASAPDALLLGVTPELHGLPWPEGTKLTAVDRSQEMIDAVWPGSRSDAFCADWCELALPPASCDLVLCDGGFTLLEYPAQQARLAALVRRWLRPGGRCVFRLFAPPARRESVADVMNDLRARRIPDLNALKLRLWLALQESAEQGVEPRRVWQLVHHEAGGDLLGLARSLGWPEEHVLALESHRESTVRYHFSSPELLARLFCDGDDGLRLVSVRYADVPLGACCPVVLFDKPLG